MRKEQNNSENYRTIWPSTVMLIELLFKSQKKTSNLTSLPLSNLPKLSNVE